MDKSFDKLRRTVLHAVDEQRSLPKTAPLRHQYVFAQYVRVQLTKLGMTDQKFAQSVHLPLEQVRLMLDGVLSEESLTEAVLWRLSHSLGCEVNLLCIMLNRPLLTADDQDDLTETAAADDELDLV